MKNIGSTTPKNGLHPRNPHRYRYNFDELVKSCSELSQYIKINQYGDETVSFSDPAAVKMLNRALLKHFYKISYWDIPDSYLCPPVPGRADYIHHIADLLSSSNNNIIPCGEKISVLDIGVGANCIYPIIGCREYGWHFTGTDIDPESLNSADKIITENDSLRDRIDLRLQKYPDFIFRDIVLSGEKFDITTCNPPFHSSPEEAVSVNLRKLTNLNRKKIQQTSLNFGGQNTELWCTGGEEAFISKMIHESSHIKENCLWFTTLVSKKTTLPSIYKLLRHSGVSEIRTINMSHGNKSARIAAWSFQNKKSRIQWVNERWE